MSTYKSEPFPGQSTTGGTPMFICGPTTGCGKLTPCERLNSGWVTPRNCMHCGKEWRRLVGAETMSAIRDMTHADVCQGLGVAESHPAPWWLPYAVQATVIYIMVDGFQHSVFGGSYHCGHCGFGLDIRPGPDTQHPEPEALLRCPQCGFDGVRSR